MARSLRPGAARSSEARRSRALARDLAGKTTSRIAIRQEHLPPATIGCLRDRTADPPRNSSPARFRIVSLKVKGRWTRILDPPRNYERFFPRDEPPETDPERRQYAREILGRFATRAFRRPVDDRTLDRLVAIAEGIYRSRAIASSKGWRGPWWPCWPRRALCFAWRRPNRIASPSVGKYPYVDEYALASRLSYFLWSTMPDDELIRLAERGELRKDLAAR